MDEADCSDRRCRERPWPRAGVSAAIFRADDVLLIERAKGALAGLWSLPGGHIEPGETSEAAALRELREETGIEAELAGVVGIHDVLLRHPGGMLAAHYVIAVFAGRWRSGEPMPASDARCARFVPLDALARMALTDGAERLIRAAAQRLTGAGPPG